MAPVRLAKSTGIRKRQGDQARCMVRSVLTQHVVPRTPDGKSPNFTAHSTLYEFLCVPPVASEKAESEDSVTLRPEYIEANIRIR